MTKSQVKKILNGLFLLIFGFIDIVLLIRILLKLLGASTKSTFVEFWYNLSDPLFGAFAGTLNDLTSGNIVVEINAIVAMIVYAIFAALSLYLINAIFRYSLEEKLVKLVDWFFKVVESLLGMRLILKLLGAGSSSFVTFLYGISSPFYKPFEGMFPHIGQGKVEFEISTFIAIIIIIILDFASDKLFDEIFKNSGGDGIQIQNDKKDNSTIPVTPVPASSHSNQSSPPSQNYERPSTTTVNIGYSDQNQQPQTQPTQPQITSNPPANLNQPSSEYNPGQNQIQNSTQNQPVNQNPDAVRNSSSQNAGLTQIRENNQGIEPNLTQSETNPYK